MKLKVLKVISPIVLLPLALASCASMGSDQETETSSNNAPVHFQPAVNQSLVKTKVVTQYVAVPVPGQLKYLKDQGKNLKNVANKTFKNKEDAIQYANKAALRNPNSRDFVNSIMNYQFMDGASYAVYASPGQMTDIEFQSGEKLISQAAGDTLRWQIGKTVSGSGAYQREHLLIKPNQTGLKTTMVVMTDQRVYHIQLISTPDAYMQAVKWQYPNENVVTYQSEDNSVTGDTRLSTAGASGLDVNIASMYSHYTTQSLQGDTRNFTPVLVFDDGVKTYIKFNKTTLNRQMPLVEVDTGDKTYVSSVNYHVKGQYIIIEGVYHKIRLQLGTKLADNLALIQINRKEKA
ncbi:TrbG/VirB9 family P-type conjugative transfer protein [Piscirickettsia salmonis]|uniref:TrbG/VirB9 family P-type conjugative transfer protein n=1 Tax=Piscirickettsia salmonis TaxID=1238 RepID=UPI000F0999A8|nr:conjugal transfer protein [Piscirickettsiaceae bacterium NZ-RLO2]